MTDQTENKAAATSESKAAAAPAPVTMTQALKTPDAQAKPEGVLVAKGAVVVTAHGLMVDSLSGASYNVQPTVVQKPTKWLDAQVKSGKINLYK